MPFKSSDGGRLNDEAFLRLLAVEGAERPAASKGQRPGGSQLADLPLTAEDVAKVQQLRDSSAAHVKDRETSCPESVFQTACRPAYKLYHGSVQWSDKR